MESIKCKNCPEVIEVLPSGTWTTLDGFCYCKKQIGDEAPMLHEPLIPIEWRDRIKTLAASSTAWTPREISRLTQLPEDVIKEILVS